jgi:DNA-binding response OmpR family regulator
MQMATTKDPYLQILIAEREPDIQKLYKRYLDSVGVTPVIVGSGNECLASLFSGDNNFDMVIIDTHLRDIAGISLAKRIREVMPDQRIILTSTTSADYLAEDMRSLEIQEEDVLVKPFRFAHLLSLIRPNVSRISKIGLTDHVLAFYDNPELEMLEAFAFVKSALRNNETALLIVRKDTDIDDLKSKMDANGIAVDKLLSTNALILMRNDDWYIPDSHLDKKRIIAQWYELVDRCTASGTNGLKAFCMMDCFFEKNLAEEVVGYEEALPAKFDIPFVPICAYRQQDIDTLSEDQRRRLLTCHSHVWLESSRNQR